MFYKTHLFITTLDVVYIQIYRSRKATAIFRWSTFSSNNKKHQLSRLKRKQCYKHRTISTLERSFKLHSINVMKSFTHFGGIYSKLYYSNNLNVKKVSYFYGPKLFILNRQSKIWNMSWFKLALPTGIITGNRPVSESRNDYYIVMLIQPITKCKPHHRRLRCMPPK